VAEKGAFNREADMLAPLVGHAQRVLGFGFSLREYFEVQTTHGVVDLLFVEADESVLAVRSALNLPPIVDATSVATLMALTQLGAWEGADHAGAVMSELFPRVPVSGRHLHGRILPALADAGWALPTSSGGWLARKPYRLPVSRIVAVEAKRSEWRRALAQAARHTDFADATYVALDAANVTGLDRLGPAFRFAGVGLLTVSSINEGQVERRLKAGRRRPRGLARAVVGERVAALRATGARSGVVGHVFGRFLAASSGVDPRFALVGGDHLGKTKLAQSVGP
jgi:hypothetical protein